MRQKRKARRDWKSKIRDAYNLYNLSEILALSIRDYGVNQKVSAKKQAKV